MACVQVLRIKEIFIALQLVLLPLSLQHAALCPTIEQQVVVATTSEAETLAEALMCDGPGVFTVSWNGGVMLSRTLSVSNGSTLDVTGSSSDSTNSAVIGDGTILLFEVDLGSTVSLTGLTLSRGNGSLSVAGESLVEVVDCIFMFNDNTSTTSHGGAISVDSSSLVLSGDIVFANNTASRGGAVYVGDSSYASFGGKINFANNTAEEYGGAIYSGSGSEINVTEAAISVSFFNNHAGDGGAIRLYDQSVFNIYGTASFVSNEAVYDGGAFAAENSELNLFGNISFEGNHAFDDGGAVYVVWGSSASFGGEIVFANNTAEDKGGATYYGYGSELNVTEEGRVSFFNNHAGYSGGAIRLYNQSGFNSYGTVSFVSNKAGSYGDEMRDITACNLWRLEMFNDLPFATPESGHLWI